MDGSIPSANRGSRAAEPTDGAAIGGEAGCPHPAEAVESLGLGGPLRFRRCGRCGAVVVTALGG